jgi:serine/threonine protein kinase
MKYAIESRLGVGGMAEVFRARLLGAAGFSRVVAIKRVNAMLSGDETFSRLFIEEAHTAALLQHPNIVAVLDFDRDDTGALFLAMELVDGADLAKIANLALAAGGRLPFGLSAYVCAEALRGLGYAHELVHEGRALRIVHRDVSPQNILIARTGSVKVADFGIAKVSASASAVHSGVIKGKLAYMAPEQASAQPLDARADIYAMGVVLYELLSGARAFEGETEAAILSKVLRGDYVPLEQRAPDVPVALAQIVRQMMAYDREHRYPTAGTAIEALRGSACFPTDGQADLVRLVGALLAFEPAAAPVNASAPALAVGSQPQSAASLPRSSPAATLVLPQAGATPPPPPAPSPQTTTPSPAVQPTSSPSRGGGRLALAAVLLVGALAGVAWVVTRSPTGPTNVSGTTSADAAPSPQIAAPEQPIADAAIALHVASPADAAAEPLPDAGAVVEQPTEPDVRKGKAEKPAKQRKKAPSDPDKLILPADDDGLLLPQSQRLR